MRFNRFRLFISAIIVVIFSSCLTTNEPTVASSDPTFVSFTMSNDTVKAVAYTLVGNTIMNVDSVLFGARINAIKPTFTFKSSSSIQVIFPNDSIVTLTGKETIDFTHQPLRVRNYAADGTPKEYFVKINVHQVEPELYVWKKLGENLLPANVISQKTIIRNDSLFHYASNGTDVFLNISTDGKNWKAKATTGIPATNTLSDLTVYKGKMYFTQDGLNIYSSLDGFNWTKKSVSEFEFQSLLYKFNKNIWAVVRLLADNTYRFAKSEDGDIWTVTTYQAPTDFPVRDFSALSFSTRNNVPKVVVLGGYNWNNEYKKNNWSSQDGVNWINFSSPISISQHQLDTLAPGASIINYDNKILMFGSTDKEGSKFPNHYRQSIDEGMSWQKPIRRLNGLHESEFRIDTIKKDSKIVRYDTIYNVVYEPRNFQSVMVNSQQQIFIVGGKSGSTVLTDVWTGKLNRLSFIKQ